MSANAGQSLSLFLSPAWLALLPLAALPPIAFFFRSKKLIPAPAGWGISNEGFIFSRISWRFWRAFFSALSLLSILLALAKPVRPEIQAFKAASIGHHWAIVLDCSGSMAQIDPGQTQSRLIRLTKAFRNEIRQSPSDRFTIIRVAGFADRIGPPAANGEFLDQILNEITPATPGEDGTSLADGLILAMDELRKHGQGGKRNKSIILISDGRDNPPDPASPKLADIDKLVQEIAFPLHWLNLNLPALENESPESKKSGDLARNVLNTMARNSGGSIININQNMDWNAITGATLDRLLPNDQKRIPSASLMLLILASVFITISLVFAILIVLNVAKAKKTAHIGLRSGFKISVKEIMQLILFYRLEKTLILFHSVAFLCILSFLIQFFQNNHAITVAQNPVKAANKAIALLIDVSPSMAAKDTPDQNRLESAKRLAQTITKEALLQQGCIISIHAFSGRPVALTPWMSEDSAAQSVISELQLRQIRPDGSDWNLLLQHVEQIWHKLAEKNRSVTGALECMIITDGEASVPPSSAAIDFISQKSIKIHCIMLGSDREPGMTFSADQSGSPLWPDKSTKEPARTKRDDQWATKITTASGGKLYSIGTAAFKPFEIADDFISSNSIDMPRFPARPKETMQLIIAALFILMVGEIIDFFRRRKRSLKLIPLILLLIGISACGKFNQERAFEFALMQAREYQQSGRFAESERILRQIEKKYPDDASLHYDLGLVLLGQAEYENAMIEFQNANKLISAEAQDNRLLSARATYAIGYAEALRKNWQIALQQMQTAIDSEIMNQPDLHNERNEIAKNIDYIRLKIAAADQMKQKADTETSNHKSNFNQFAELPTQIDLIERATEARARSRTARQTFEKTGDQIIGPLPKISGRPVIDW